VFQTEKLLKEQADKVQADDREKMEAALKELKDALAGTDIDAVKRGHENLVTVSQDFAQRLYQQAQATQSAGDAPGAGAPGPDDDEVADAEIVDEPGEESA
jgi:molecular chaperone DnaK